MRSTVTAITRFVACALSGVVLAGCGGGSSDELEAVQERLEELEAELAEERASEVVTTTGAPEPTTTTTTSTTTTTTTTTLPPPGTVVDRVDVDAGPLFLTHDGSSIWVFHSGGSLVKVDAESGELIKTLRFALGGDSVGNVAFLGEFLWVVLPNQIHKIDPSSGDTVETFATDFEPTEVVADGYDLWIAGAPSGSSRWDWQGTIWRFSTVTGELTSLIEFEGFPSIGVFEGHLWVDASDALLKVDKDTGAVVRRIAMPSNTFDFAFDGNHIWLTLTLEPEVLKIDPNSGEILETFLVNDTGTFVASDGTYVYVANSYSSTSLLSATISRIETATGELSLIDGFQWPSEMLFDGTYLWVMDNGADELVKVVAG